MESGFRNGDIDATLDALGPDGIPIASLDPCGSVVIH